MNESDKRNKIRLKIRDLGFETYYVPDGISLQKEEEEIFKMNYVNTNLEVMDILEYMLIVVTSKRIILNDEVILTGFFININDSIRLLGWTLKKFFIKKLKLDKPEYFSIT